MSKEQLIDLDKKQLELLKKIIGQHIPNKTVWAYGSRITWKANETSDLDLAVFDCNSTDIYALKEALEESNLLISVDVMDWETIPDDFKANIKKKYAVLQEKQDLEGWREVRLEDFLILQRGHDLPKVKMQAGPFPVAGSNGIIGYHTTATTKGPGVTIGRSGNIGNAYLYKKDFWAHNTTLYVKDFKGNNQIFAYYFLKNINFVKLNAGSAVPTLNRNHIHPIRFNLPPLPEQKAIAEILSSLDDKIDLLHRQNKTLEATAQTLFHQYFTSKTNKKIVKQSLDYFGEIICGKTPSKKVHEYYEGEIPFIKIPDMHNKTFVFNTADTLTEKGRDSQQNKILPSKSICVSCIATVGLVAMNASEAQTNQQINSIIPRKHEYTYFLYLFMKSSKNLLKAMADGGSVTSNLNTRDFSKIMIPLDEELISAFHGIINPIFDTIYLNQTQINTLQSLRDTLLPKLMAGTVQLSIL